MYVLPHSVSFKSLDYCNGNLCPGNLKHLTCDVRFVSNFIKNLNYRNNRKCNFSVG